MQRLDVDDGVSGCAGENLRYFDSPPWVQGQLCPIFGQPLETQLHKPNRPWEPRKTMGRAWELHRTLMGASPGITLRLPRGPPASAGPGNISQAYGQRVKGSFPACDAALIEGSGPRV